MVEASRRQGCCGVHVMGIWLENKRVRRSCCGEEATIWDAFFTRRDNFAEPTPIKQKL